MSVLEREHGRDAIDETQRALLNILEDLTAEQSGFEAGQRAVLNILDDAEAEKVNLERAQRAVLNILHDSEVEKTNLQGAQRAVVNILEDSEAENVSLQSAQRAVVNILEDLDSERSTVEVTNRELQAQIEERVRAQHEINALNASLESRVAELATANQELEAFTYSVAHDLRAPLRGIDGFSLALLEDFEPKLDPEAQGYLGRIRTGVSRMGRLIDDLLHLSRISRAEVRREKVDLSALALAGMAELQKSAPERALDFVIPPSLEVDGDPNLLRIVLDNLLGNAWKFSAKRIPARIEVGTEEQNGRHVYFVRDNGAGFDMKYVGKLFAPFQRLHAASEFPGTGIGLVTVARIVRKHGGKIWAEGEVDKGATLYFTLEKSIVCS